MSAIHMFSRLKSAFRGAHGGNFRLKLAEKAAEAAKMRGKRPRPCLITVGGDQLTGKSTLAKSLCQVPDVFGPIVGKESNEAQRTVISSGTTFRELAKERGLTVAELSKRLGNDEDLGMKVDVELDYRTCELICSSAGFFDAETTSSSAFAGDLLVLEGRQPAVMATFCAEHLGLKRRILSPFRVFLKCSAREQALRYAERAIGTEAKDSLASVLTDKHENFAQAVKEIESLEFDHKESIMKCFVDNMNRDRDDMRRFDLLYGPECNYRNENFYDLIVDTSGISAEEKVDCVLSSFQNWMEEKSFS